MGEFFGFVISIFSGWKRIAGLLTLIWAAAILIEWITQLYVPYGMQDIDQSIICCGVMIMAACSVVFMLMEPDAPKAHIKTRPYVRPDIMNSK